MKPKIRGLGALCVLLGSLLSTGCSGLLGRLHLIEGGFYSAQGRYEEALGAYQASLGYEKVAPYGHYGLGCVYLAQDRGEEALFHFEEARKELDREEKSGLIEKGGADELRYRIAYNRGVLRMGMEDYPRAAASFQEALEYKEGRRGAQRNLELSLLAMKSRGSGAIPPVIEGGEDEDEGSLFDYLRQKEQEQWRSREWTGSGDYEGPDY